MLVLVVCSLIVEICSCVRIVVRSSLSAFIFDLCCCGFGLLGRFRMTCEYPNVPEAFQGCRCYYSPSPEVNICIVFAQVVAILVRAG